jgi:integrase
MLKQSWNSIRYAVRPGCVQGAWTFQAIEKRDLRHVPRIGSAELSEEIPGALDRQLIARDVDIVTVSKRLGHAKPSITLAIYAHLFHTDDRKAAAAINAALPGA